MENLEKEDFENISNFVKKASEVRSVLINQKNFHDKFFAKDMNMPNSVKKYMQVIPVAYSAAIEGLEVIIEYNEMIKKAGLSIGKSNSVIDEVNSILRKSEDKKGGQE